MDPLLLLLIAISSVYLIKRRVDAKRRAPLPPGPPQLPLVGNLYDWPTKDLWKTFTKWGELYGDMVYVNVSGVDIIVLNSLDTATEMLVEKGENYSDRPPMYFMNNHIGWGSSTISLDDNADLRNQRRFITKVAGSKSGFEPYLPVIESRTRQFVRRLLGDQVVDIHHHSRWLAGAIILDVTYGYQAQDEDELMDLAETAMADYNEALVPGKYLVDAYPWIDYLPSWLPGMGYRQIGAKMRESYMRFIGQPFQFTKDQEAAGVVRPSMVATHLPEVEQKPELESMLKYAAGVMYAGGTETIISSISHLFYYMTLYPDIQEKARAEIDSVVGTQRLPEAQDLPHLPYTKAVLDEVFRCGLIVPQGMTHRAREADIHNGFFIPKNAVVIPHVQFVSRDPRHHKDPEKFDPERFLGEKPELDPRTWVFGFGRRRCPGYAMADSNLLLILAISLATLHINKALDPDGNEITPQLQYLGFIITCPDKFPCKLVPRSEHALALLRDSDI